MNLYILEYKRTMYTVQFNILEDEMLHHELFNKKSDLYRRIEEIKDTDSVYMNYKELKIYNLDMEKLKVNIEEGI